MMNRNLTPSFIIALAVVGLAVSGRAEEPFDYFTNSWSVVGLKDYLSGTRITPDNRLLLQGGQAVMKYGIPLTPLSRNQTKLNMEGWLPVILLSASDGPVRYEWTMWATPLPTAKDWKKAFDWPTEGENYLNWIVVKATNHGNKTAEAKVSIEQTGVGALAAQLMTWKLKAGESARDVVRIPFSPIADAHAFDKEDAQLWLDRTVQYWKQRLAGAAKIEVPCKKATDTLLSAHVCQLIANDHGEVHGGEGFYDKFFIRDGAYQVLELEESGLWDVARKSLDSYLACQLPEGRFQSPGGFEVEEWDANGQAVWVLWQYYKLTGDRAWLEQVYPRMMKAVEWTMKARREAAADSPFAGLLPAAIADGESLFDINPLKPPKDGSRNKKALKHIVGYDLWNLRGMLCTADAARILGKASDFNKLTAEAKSYREAIDAAWRKTGLAHFPPSWEKLGTFWGNTETLWPTELFEPNDPRVAGTIRYARHDLGGGFKEGTIQWLGFMARDVIHPYMSAYTTMASLSRGEDEQVVEDFYWYLLHSTATHAFPEGIYRTTRVAWSDLTPHVTGACNYAILLRHMLVHERGEELHLLSAVPDWWLENGQIIRVERAPTSFGLMNLTLRGGSDGVTADIQLPSRLPPKRVVLHLPQHRKLTKAIPGIEVDYRPEQKKRWDFPTVVKLYQEQLR